MRSCCAPIRQEGIQSDPRGLVSQKSSKFDSKCMCFEKKSMAILHDWFDDC